MVTWHDEPTQIKFDSHSDRHEDGGADEISLAGLTVAAEDISFTLEEVATATTLTADHFLVVVNTSSSDIIITLPPVASHANRVYTIKNIGSGKVTIYADGTEKIEWEDNLVLGLQGDVVDLTTSGAEIEDTDWFIIGGRNVKLEDILRDLLTKILDELKDATDKLKDIKESTSSLDN